MTPRLRTAAGGALVAALLFAGLAWANPAGAQRLVNERLVEDIRPSDLLGGGDKVFVRFGADAAFGVLWGNATNPNHVYMVALKARYLGVAQVVDESGRVTFTDVYRKGAKRIELPGAAAPLPNRDKKPRRASYNPSPADFPRIDAGTQKRRDASTGRAVPAMSAVTWKQCSLRENR